MKVQELMKYLEKMPLDTDIQIVDPVVGEPGDIDHVYYFKADKTCWICVADALEDEGVEDWEGDPTDDTQELSSRATGVVLETSCAVVEKEPQYCELKVREA
jgi:hypothetical protein